MSNQGKSQKNVSRKHTSMLQQKSGGKSGKNQKKKLFLSLFLLFSLLGSGRRKVALSLGKVIDRSVFGDFDSKSAGLDKEEGNDRVGHQQHRHQHVKHHHRNKPVENNKEQIIKKKLQPRQIILTG